MDDAGYAYPINDERTEALNRQSQTKIYEDTFHKQTNNRYEELRAVISQFARDIITYFESQEIYHNLAFKNLSKLFLMNNYYRLKDLPEHWVNELVNSGDGPKYRVRMLELLIQKEMRESSSQNTSN